MKQAKTLILLGLICMFGYNPKSNAQLEISYGLTQDTLDPLLITAVLYTNFDTSALQLFAGTQFTIILPEGTSIDPMVANPPGSTGMTNINGTWTGQQLDSALMEVHPICDPSDLLGNIAIYVGLTNSPTINNIIANTPVELFSFRLPDDCQGGSVEVLTNDNTLQSNVLGCSGINLNNATYAYSGSNDIYVGNNPGTFQLPCPLDDGPDAVDDFVSADEDAIDEILNVLINDDFGNNPPELDAIDIITAPVNGTASVNDGGTPNNPTDDVIEYTSDLNYNGPDSLSYSICDADGDCDTAWAIITVNATNDPPIAINDINNTLLNTAVSGNVLTNDFDIDGDNLLASTSPISGPSSGILSIAADGSYTYTPDNGFIGTDIFSYEVCDNGAPSMCDTASVTIKVREGDPDINDAPIANDDNTQVEENESLEINVVANDTDPDGDNLGNPAVIAGSGPSNGGLVNNGDGTFTYSPDPDFVGTDQFSYQICDDGAPSLCDTATVTIEVTPDNGVDNDAPVAIDDAVSGSENSGINGNASTNDYDPEADPLVFADLPGSGPSNGSLNFNPDGTFTYTPLAGYNGPDHFEYTVCETGTIELHCDTATVYISVFPTDGIHVVTTPEDTPVDICSPSIIPDIPNFDNISSLGCEANGTLDISYNGTSDTCVTYTPNLNFVGVDTACVVVCDNGAMCDTVQIVIVVTPVTDVVDVETPEESPVQICSPSQLTDIDELNSITSLGCEAHGTLDLSFDTNGDTCITYTPNADVIGSDTACVVICEGNGLCDTTIIVVTITPVTDTVPIETPEDTPRPICSPSELTMPTDYTSIISLMCESNGTLNITYDPETNDTCIVYTPSMDFNGMDTACVVVCTSGGLCDTTIFPILVTPLPDAPVAVDDMADINEGSTNNAIDVADNDSDVDGDLDPNSVVIISGPFNGDASPSGGGIISYSPDMGFIGPDSLTYVICDQTNPTPLCDTAIVRINVVEALIRIRPIVMLQGALINTDDSTLMRDALRSRGLLPTTEPYTALAGFTHINGGGEQITDPGVLDVTGPDAIVDWVFIELRDSSDNSIVIETRSALIQRDGDVVDVDGVSPVLFAASVPDREYYISIRHRNHLGALMDQRVLMSSTVVVIDFTDLGGSFYNAIPLYDGAEQSIMKGKFALTGGNANINSSTVFQGQGSDQSEVQSKVLNAPGNPLHLPNYIYSGYHAFDVDLDGSAIANGQNNDVVKIYNIIIGHPANFFQSNAFVVDEQLP